MQYVRIALSGHLRSSAFVKPAEESNADGAEVVEFTHTTELRAETEPVGPV